MNYRKKIVEDIPEEDTPIWSCTKEGCKGWMRDNFTLEHNPSCPLCSSPMVSGTRMLPTIVNFNVDRKAIKNVE